MHSPQRTSSLVAALATFVLLALPLASCGGPSNDIIGLIGDSITDLSRDPLQKALGSDHKVEIVGKFGARSDQVIDDVKVIAASKPGQAVINIGTNDAIQQVPATQTRANIQQMIDLLKGSAACMFLVQINTGITDKATGSPRQAEAQAINDQLAELATANRHVKVINWNATIEKNGGNGAVTFDTVHLSEKGIVLMAQAYREALDSC